MKLKELTINQSGRVVGFAGGDSMYRHKLLRMGLVKGAVFTVVRKAPLGDPVEIQLDDLHLTLRKHEADALDVEAI
jgi:ferrous iron transport protein A